MARLKTNNGGGDDTYTRNTKVVTKKGTPEKRELYNEPGTVQRKRTGGVEFMPTGTEERDSKGSIVDPKSRKSESKDQQMLIESGQDVYKGADLEKAGHKKGDIISVDSKGKKLAIGRVGEKVTPATPDEYAEKKQISVTHKRDVQSSNGHPEKGKDLESKGYKPQGGTYYYEKPERQEWVDEDKAEEYLKANPDARKSNPDRKAEEKKEAVVAAERKRKVKYVRGGAKLAN